jgi:hypothetical protein
MILSLPWRSVGVVLVLLLGARTTYLATEYLLDGITRRHHVEASALLFVVAGLVLKFASARGQSRERVSSLPPPGWLAAGYVGVSLMLYAPALQVGFLSDDFVLLQRAARWDVGEVTPALLRPVPLVVWAALASFHAPAWSWHALNVVLHGINAFLVARVAAGWMRAPWPLLAGALMLTAPLAPEAVVWASGVFDVSATTLALAAVLIARAYERGPRLHHRVGLIAAGLLALGCKETTAVLPALVLIDAWVRHAIRRVLLVDLAILTGIAGVFGIVRLVGAFGLTAPPVSRYIAQRVLFESYGSLIVPWHDLVLTSAPWVAVVAAGLVAILFATFVITRSSVSWRLAPGTAMWILVAVLPVAPILFIAPDLQGSRYLYLAAPAWAGLMAGMAAQGSGRVRLLTGPALAMLIVLTGWGVWCHLEPWQAAAAARDQVLVEVRRAIPADCGSVSLRGLPDHVGGAYVFRNGAAEALAGLGIAVRLEASPNCVLAWDAVAQRFVVSRP